MSATHYGLTAGLYTTRPNFRASRDEEGLYTGSEAYNMPHDTWENGVSGLFSRGTAITDLSDYAAAFWSFMALDSLDVENRPGGYVEVTVQYKGYNTAEFGEGGEETFILSGIRKERSILLHPLYIKEMHAEDERVFHRAIVQAYNGLWAFDESSPDQSDVLRSFYYVPDLGRANYNFTSENAVKWAIFILEDGNRTYMAPTLQWTRESANLSGLDEEQLSKLGLEDEPPGNPPEPFHGDNKWLKTGLTDVRGTGGSSTSETWELSPPQGFPKFNNGKSIYDWELSDLAS